METTKFRITYSKLGVVNIVIINDSLTKEEKNMVKYALYKKLNGSYHKLIKFLPPNGEA